MKEILVSILFILTSLGIHAQAQLVGFAPDFIGEKVVLYTYEDYVTMNRVQIGESIVRASDSSFTIDLTTTATIKGIIEIDNNESSLYLAPKGIYSVYFPRSKEPVSYMNAETDVYFSDLDTNDINYRILQYHEWFDMFVSYYQQDIARGGFLAYLDTFKRYAATAYKEIEDPFFITYVRYDIAEMEQTYGGNRVSSKRLNTWADYIEPFPVYYENDRYMKFMLGFFDKQFGEYLPATETQIMNAIAKSSPFLLMQALRRDVFLADPELRELVMIDKLGKAFYKELQFRPNIISILDSVANYAKNPVNAKVANNVKNYITSLEPGYPAPAIQLVNSEQEVILWSHYKGKFVYFNFFSTWNDRAVKDMEIIAKLAPKYDADIAFVSVCTDEDSSSYVDFLMKHPEYFWDIYYVGEDQQLMNAFKVVSVPNYYLVDQDGFIFSAPALAPSPNGEYESVEKTLFSIQKALHPDKAIRVGER